jgi:hypothetical protein
MVESSTALAPFVKSIFHPSDFSKASELACARALAIALIRRTELVIMHAGRESIGDWARFPPVRKTLERWQVLAPGSRRSALFDRLTMRVTKVSPRRRSGGSQHDPDRKAKTGSGRARHTRQTRLAALAQAFHFESDCPPNQGDDFVCAPWLSRHVEHPVRF